MLLNVNSMKELDTFIIPQVIYNETIEMNTKAIQNYFIQHPQLLVSFVGFNSTLKQADNLLSNKKCGCYYKIPWITNYASINNIQEPIQLSFSQQVNEYRYMIYSWKPSPEISYMKYLSEISLQMIQDIKQSLYFRNNNLEYNFIFHKQYYISNFTDKKQFMNYISTYF
jgi:hypothetical protein